jgi:monovalent cation:H+ antiporter-2, CPA2 family
VQQPLAFGTEGLNGHLVVAGFGRTGRAVARVLGAAGLPFLITELDHAMFSDASAQGLRALWGDISQEEILRAAGIDSARVLVLTVPDQGTIRLGAQRARRLNQRVVIIARAIREHNVAELRVLGVDSVVQPEFEGGIEMVRQALIPYQYEESRASELISDLRSDLYGENRAKET